MPSPFPGMDPYLERHWRDVHSRLIIYACDQLQPRLPPDLRARVEERVMVDTPDGESRSIAPDVRIVETSLPPGVDGGASATTRGGAATEPLVIDLRDDPEIQTYVEIREVAAGRRLITAVEFLSPSNKLPGDGQELYLKTRAELVGGSVNLVEIDLLRFGVRKLPSPVDEVPAVRRAPYLAIVRHALPSWKAEVYPISLREPLPSLRVPLRRADPDVVLELQPLLAACWRQGGYDDIDYSEPPDPPLNAADATWARELMEGRSRV
ncbi:MAG: DUF4058 family protein [Planctomycetes bacterium]|nr:DUF4058 family protein [Planctomycetota bacterium]